MGQNNPDEPKSPSSAAVRPAPSQQAAGEPTQPPRAAVYPTGPQPAAGQQTVQQQLAEQEAWLANARAQIELDRLKDIRRRFEAGDTSAILETPTAQASVTVPTYRPSAPLPRPKDPQHYKKTDRGEYGRWERDCEAFFHRAPTHFPVDQVKIDFGLQYISEDLKTLWNANVTSQRLSNRLWSPTWENFKLVMLDALDTPQERKHLAYQKLRAARQRAGQSPTDLLNCLRPIYEELGETLSPDAQVLAFTGGLNETVHYEVMREHSPERNTLTKAENLAMRVWRRQPENKPTKDTKGKAKVKANRDRASSLEVGESSKPPKKTKKPSWVKNGPKNRQNVKSRDKVSSEGARTCWGYGQPGHLKSECPSKKNKDSSHTSAKSDTTPREVKGQQS